MRFRPALCVFILALGIAACGALAPIAEKPQVRVHSVSLGSASFVGMDGEVAMDIYNPNGFGLPLSRIDWTLSVGRAEAVRGSFDLSETIPARASAPVVGRLHIDAVSAALVAAQVAQGARSYQIQATLHFHTRLGALTAEVRHEAELL